jgi:hypothetical protein
MRAIAAIFIGLMISTSVADAIQIAPECKGMQDPIGCTCAVQNGGAIRARAGGGQRWVSKAHGGAGTNEAFVQCNIKARGHQ